MAFSSPPDPERSDDPPPAPVLAQRLVAEAGVAVYEGGASLFDEPVLVYVARGKGRCPDFDVFDHVGRPLGSSDRDARRPRLFGRRPLTVRDAAGDEVFVVRQGSAFLRHRYRVEGVVDADMVTTSVGGKELAVTANNERFGSVVGKKLLRTGGGEVEVRDMAGQPVGRLFIISNKEGIFARSEHYVMALDPQLRGPYRRLLVAVPPVVALIRVAEEEAAAAAAVTAGGLQPDGWPGTQAPPVARPTT